MDMSSVTADMPGTNSGATDPATADTDTSAGAVPARVRDYWPTDGWQEKTPEEVGMDSAKLEEAFALVQTRSQDSADAMAVFRNGYLVAEEYFGLFNAQQRHISNSMAKSFSSALLGIAIDQGLVSGVDAMVCEFYDEWDCNDSDDARSRIKIEHILTLTSGLDWIEDWSPNGARDDVYALALGGGIQHVLSKRSGAEPGTRFQYSTGDPALLSGILQKVTGKMAYDFGKEVMFDKIGIGGITWGQQNGYTTTYSNLQATAREYAKFGFLYLNEGQWDGEQIVSKEWVHVSTTPGKSLEPWYGYLWHVNAPVKWETPELPENGYAAIGANGQYVIVMPTEDVIIVRLASDRDSSFEAGKMIKAVLDSIM